MTRIALFLSLLCTVSVAFGEATADKALQSLQNDPVALRQAVESGRKAAFFCFNCHGETGLSKLPEVPNLAGQHPAYLLDQIHKFDTGERKNAFMQGLIKVLKDDERRNIAMFYASQPVPPGRSDAAKAEQGKQLFAKLCVRCHGEQARGGEHLPRLAGQNTAYLQVSIARYRDGTGIRNDRLMSIATAPLTNDDIAAVAAYLTQLP